MEKFAIEPPDFCKAKPCLKQKETPAHFDRASFFQSGTDTCPCGGGCPRCAASAPLMVQRQPESAPEAAQASLEGFRNKHLKAARKACEYARSVLSVGMGNLMNAPDDPRHQRRLQQSQTGFANLFRSFWPGVTELSPESFEKMPKWLLQLLSQLPKGFLESLNKMNQIPAEVLAKLGGWLGYQLAYYGPEFALIVERIKDAPGDLTDLGIPPEAGPRRAAATGSKLHIGNCEEHAAVAYTYLLENIGKPRPLEIFHRPDHAFVVIGRRKEGEFDPEMVICDPYYNEVYCLGENLCFHSRQDLEDKSNYKTSGRVEF